MTDQAFWDERYSSAEYLYGTEANAFLAEHVARVSGPVLSLSEGEGRNAVFLAKHGLDVLGVDCSAIGLEKAQNLAAAQSVQIRTKLADLAEYSPAENHFGSVVSISAHLPSTIRKRLYPLLEKSLKPGGTLILEAYSEDQLNYETGGPKDIDMLMSLDKLSRELPNLEPILARIIERNVIEGTGHSGLASVVQYIAKKQT